MATKASILDDLQAVPPGKTLSDKYFIGFYDGETLAAMMDLITGYPNPATAYIGLFMVFPLWNVLPAVSGCFGRKTTNGCRSSNV